MIVIPASLRSDFIHIAGIRTCSGFTVTLLFVVLSVFPVIDVANPVSYAWKTVAVVVGVNTLGAILYTRRKKKSCLADP